jgi:hypothetical protein
MLRAPLEHRRHSQRGVCGRCRAVPPAAVADRAQAAPSGGNWARGHAQERASGAHHDAIAHHLGRILGLGRLDLGLEGSQRLLADNSRAAKHGRGRTEDARNTVPFRTVFCRAMGSWGRMMS